MNWKPVAQAIEDVTGIRPPPGTWRRWIRNGLVSASGTRVKLKTKKLGRIYTTDDWVREFVAATASDLKPTSHAAPNSRSISANEYLRRELGDE